MHRLFVLIVINIYGENYLCHDGVAAGDVRKCGKILMEF